MPSPSDRRIPSDHPVPPRRRFRSPTRETVRPTFARGADRLVLAVQHVEPQGGGLAALDRWTTAYGAAVLGYHRFEQGLLLTELEGLVDVDAPRAAIDAEHAELAGAVSDTETAVRNWSTGRTEWWLGRREALAAVRAQRDDLLVHVVHEDAILLPLADAHLLAAQERIDDELRAYVGHGPGGILASWRRAEADHVRQTAVRRDG